MIVKYGEEAVEIAENNFMDVILMDLNMPIMDGYKAAKIIRELQTPERANIHIIVLTASAIDELNFG